MNDTRIDHDDELKRLELDLKIEELRKLRASRKFQWVNPAALGILLPLIGAFGLWVVSEVKGYSAAYKAVAEVAKLKEQRKDLAAEKDSLNLEIMSLLTLKAHYSDDNARLSQVLRERQQIIDLIYLRGRWAISEAIYALDHPQQGWAEYDADGLDRLITQVSDIDNELATNLRPFAEKLRLFEDMSRVSDQVTGKFLESIEQTNPSAEVVGLQWMPEGSVVPGRQVMVSSETESGAERYFDVAQGRYLTDEEVAAAR